VVQWCKNEYSRQLNTLAKEFYSPENKAFLSIITWQMDLDLADYNPWIRIAQ
jgi:uncharacterized protein YhjY with autotransporter beta-barrel domain